MSQRGSVFIWIIIGFLIAGGLLGAYYLGIKKAAVPSQLNSNTQPASTIPQQVINSPTSSSSPDETANWKTYTNGQYHYMIKYPPNMEIVRSIEGSTPNKTVIDYPQGKGYSFPPYSISIYNPTDQITDYDSTSKLDYQSFMSLISQTNIGQEVDKNKFKYTSPFTGNSTSYKRLPDGSINGKTFLIIENPEVYGGKERLELVTLNSKVAVFRVVINTSDNFQTLEKIIATFKFTQ